ncbi:bactericidal permeability-increasing protein/lipopolysaccharide-binding protein [Elysia marginata]|uniref:Bactericidal permeability-increasing protein/lipopolysaccharide-binding protein n=1 Tax=Elysia marginata TaxID=1093978 RepID=A0AAV4JN89_9GAST|nr:bactericidal permeability-increasing protein/lipopolysaccharide-binding protein [Elysia marginata]
MTMMMVVVMGVVEQPGSVVSAGDNDYDDGDDDDDDNDYDDDYDDDDDDDDGDNDYEDYDDCDDDDDDYDDDDGDDDDDDVDDDDDGYDDDDREEEEEDYGHGASLLSKSSRAESCLDPSSSSATATSRFKAGTLFSVAIAVVMATVVFWSFLVILTLPVTLCAATDPGMKIRITKKGINYANQLAGELLYENLKSLRIDDQYMRDGKTSYSTWNTRVRSVNYPGSHVSLKPGDNGVQWAISNFGITITADYRAKYRGWWTISNSGWFRASVSGVNLWETVAFGKHGGAGRPSINHRHCSSSVRHVSIKFYGRWSWVINLFKNNIARKIKSSLEPQICRQVVRVINENAQRSISQMNVVSDLAGGKFSLDNSMVKQPKVTSEYLEVYGEVRPLLKCQFD